MVAVVSVFMSLTVAFSFLCLRSDLLDPDPDARDVAVTAVGDFDCDDDDDDIIDVLTPASVRLLLLRDSFNEGGCLNECADDDLESDGTCSDVSADVPEAFASSALSSIESA